VPTYTELSAAVGQDVIVINGHSAARLRLAEVAPVLCGGTLYFRATLSGPAEVREGTHLSRIGDYLVRLHLTRVESEDGSVTYAAQAQAHIDEMDIVERVAPHRLVAV
jgi:hypothetical protein